jgi:hypothetical protein
MEDIMNPNNYGTQPACQRLLDAGIVLETDAWWILGFDGKYSLVHCATDVMRAVVKDRPGSVPAPSMAEVWREYRKHVPDYQNRGKLWNALREEKVVDALIDLLIWVKAQKEG